MLDIELWKRMKNKVGRVRYERFPPVESLPGYWIVYLTMKDREEGTNYEEAFRVELDEPLGQKQLHNGLSNKWDDLIGELP